jgi:protein O-mannosyl-transferase
MAELTKKQLTAIICLALAVGTIGLYCPVLWHPFINYDDPDYILNNPHVTAGVTWPGIVWAFKSGYAANWHPLTWISHMLDCQLFGVNHPGAHHFVNVLFHAANTVLLFVLLNYMTGAMWRSALVAALFGWHPLHVESVAWAAERKDVLSAFFWMLALLCYARYARSRVHGPQSSVQSPWSTVLSPQLAANPPSAIFHPLSSPFYWLALIFFACGLMSKPMVVTLPCVLLLLDFWPLQRFNAPARRSSSDDGPTLSPRRSFAKAGQRLILEKIPFFGLMAGSCFITMAVQKHALWSSVSLSFPFRLANALMSYVRYISKIFLPRDMALIYPYPHSWPLLGVVMAAVVLCVLTVVCVSQMKRFPYLAVGWFWFLGTLVPAIGLVQAGVQSMADRYTYLPSIGIFILVTWGITDLLASSPRKAESCAFAATMALGACVILTAIQLRYWRSSQAIFAHTVNVTADNYAADDCLGKTLQNLGDKNDAETLFELAVRLEPTYPMAQFDLGMNLLRLGNPAGAGQHLAIAVQLYPSDPVMQYDFGVFLLQHGNSKAAVEHFQAALALNPDFVQARKELDSLKR